MQLSKATTEALAKTCEEMSHAIAAFHMGLVAGIEYYGKYNSRAEAQVREDEQLRDAILAELERRKREIQMVASNLKITTFTVNVVSSNPDYAANLAILSGVLQYHDTSDAPIGSCASIIYLLDIVETMEANKEFSPAESEALMHHLAGMSEVFANNLKAK